MKTIALIAVIVPTFAFASNKEAGFLEARSISLASARLMDSSAAATTPSASSASTAPSASKVKLLPASISGRRLAAAEQAEAGAGPSEPPSLGAVLGFMITGGVLTVVGAIFTVAGVLILALPELSAFLYASAVGWTYIVVGAIHLGIGIPLFIVGNNKRVERNRYYELHGEDRVQPSVSVAAISF